MFRPLSVKSPQSYILSELDHLFGMTAWAEPPFLATECQEILIAAIWVCTPDPGEAFPQVSAFQVVMYYIVHYGTDLSRRLEWISGVVDRRGFGHGKNLRAVSAKKYTAHSMPASPVYEALLHQATFYSFLRI